MSKRRPFGFGIIAAAIALLLTFVSVPSTALSARDRTPPTRPTNLRVTAVASYSVTLTWNPSTDNSGSFSYVICCSSTASQTAPQTTTSFTFTAGLEAGRSYSFRIYAVDAAGNTSGYSNSVSATLPADTRPPTKPTVSVTDVGSTHVSLTWSSTDDGPNIWYTVFKDGSPVIQGTRDTSANITLLNPGTTYTFTVQARDFGGNNSPLSSPINATTEATNSNDTTAPTRPGNLRTNGMEFSDGETWLFWDKSTDNQTPQSLIKYEIYLNGNLDHSIVGHNNTVLYATVGMENTIQVFAIDESGNRSAPATLVVNVP